MPQFDPAPIPPDQTAVPLAVVRRDRTQEGDAQYTLLPNVQCLAIERKDGAAPSTAHFTYLLDGSDPSSPFPTSPADLWPLAAQGDYVARPDDELVVFGYTAAGVRRPLFDGFAQAPEVSWSAAGQGAGFQCVGVEIRCWDFPVDLRYDRNADDPDTADPDNHAVTSQAVRFNPNDDQGGAQGNCTPDGQDVNQDEDNAYPEFLEPRLVRAPDPATFWTLPKAVRYLLYAPDYRGNPLGTASDGTRYVLTPVASLVDKYLVDLAPKNGQTLNPQDIESYTARPILVRDYDASGKAVPDVLEELFGYNGFGVRFVLDGDEDGHPVTRLTFFRRDGLFDPAPLRLSLQPPGAALDPGRSNAGTLALARDARKLANAVVVASRPALREVGIVLAPGFRIADADADSLTQFDIAVVNADGATAQQRDAYRLFVADECGDGHWDFGAAAWATAALDLEPVFPVADGKATYARRYRPGRHTLLSRDDRGRPRRASLWVSRDYDATKAPAVWDGTGTWQNCGPGGWALEPNRLAVRLTCPNPDSWTIGPAGTGPRVNSSEVVRVVTSLARPGAAGDANGGRFALLLCTVIEQDDRIDARAEKRAASPTRFEVWERVESADHFRYDVIDQSSRYGPRGKTTELVARDDTKYALAQAEALRTARETPRVSGTVTIPYLSNAYRVGDRVDLVEGVGLSLSESAAGEAGEAARCPVVVAVAYRFPGNGQQTTLTLGDEAAAAALFERRARTRLAESPAPRRGPGRPQGRFAGRGVRTDMTVPPSGMVGGGGAAAGGAGAAPAGLGGALAARGSPVAMFGD